MSVTQRGFSLSAINGSNPEQQQMMSFSQKMWKCNTNSSKKRCTTLHL